MHLYFLLRSRDDPKKFWVDDSEVIGDLVAEFVPFLLDVFAQKARDPEMHQTRKGNQWYFGMKAHFGVDRQSKVIHAVMATAANVHDSAVLGDLLHGEETDVWGDSAYQGQADTGLALL